MNHWKAWVLALSLVAAGPFAGDGLAHQHGAPSAGHGAPAVQSDNPAIAAFKEANARMHRDMDIDFTGDSDKDFAAGMIPHHQGAVEMAQVAQQYSDDPWIRMFAQEIITTQQAEIAEMQAWLARAQAGLSAGM